MYGSMREELKSYIVKKGWKVTDVNELNDSVSGRSKEDDHLADIEAHHPIGGVNAYGIVETCKSLSTENARQRLLSLSGQQNPHNKKPVKVFVIVPEECFERFEAIMEDPELSSRGNITVLKQ